MDFDSTAQPRICAIGPDDVYLHSDAQDADLRRHIYCGTLANDLRAARGDPATIPPTESMIRKTTATKDERYDHEHTWSLHAVTMAGSLILTLPVGSFTR